MEQTPAALVRSPELTFPFPVPEKNMGGICPCSCLKFPVKLHQGKGIEHVCLWRGRQSQLSFVELPGHVSAVEVVADIVPATLLSEEINQRGSFACFPDLGSKGDVFSMVNGCTIQIQQSNKLGSRMKHDSHRSRIRSWKKKSVLF